MKKAYVKPVFLAEEFVAASSYVASACGVSNAKSLEIKDGDLLCNTHNNHCSLDFSLEGSYVNTTKYDGSVIDTTSQTGYSLNNDNGFSYWDYAKQDDQKACLFNSTIGDCDFLWSGNSNDTIWVWNSVDKGSADTSNGFIKGVKDTFKSLTGFFNGNESITGKHDVGYWGQSFRS